MQIRQESLKASFTYNNIIHAQVCKWAGLRSRYSDWVRAGRSGDRIPVENRFFRTCPDRPWGPPSLLYNRYRVFPGGKERPGRVADPSPPSSAVVTMGHTACTEHQCLYKGALFTFYSSM